MRIDEVLRASDINLALRGDDKTAVVEEVLSQLRGDDRVTNWEALRDAVIERDAAAIEHLEKLAKDDATDPLVTAYLGDLFRLVEKIVNRQHRAEREFGSRTDRPELLKLVNLPQ